MNADLTRRLNQLLDEVLARPDAATLPVLAEAAIERNPELINEAMRERRLQYVMRLLTARQQEHARERRAERQRQISAVVDSLCERLGRNVPERQSAFSKET